MRMMASSVDDAESVAAGLIADGGVGITETVLSSSMLARALTFKSNQDRFDIPRGPAMNHMLTRLGYSKLDKQVKWDGQTHTIWLKNGVEFTNEQVRIDLDGTKTRNSNLVKP
jgi:hypothetical protein